MLNDPNARAADIVSRLPEGECSMVEIGVWRGANAARILKKHPNVSITLVDPWRAAEGSYATSGSSDSRLTQKAFDATYERAMHNLSPYRGRFTVMRMTSAEAQAQAARIYDLVFIDADHSYEGCKRDIELWRNYALTIGGHDYGKDSFPGVTRAVHEAFGDAIERGLDSNWWAKQ